MRSNILLLALVFTLAIVGKAGETFILIHGATLGAWTYFKVKALLEERGHTVIAIDLPSAGVDRTDVRVVTLQSHADRVIQILDSLSKPAILVGHSYGGIMVTLASEARPKKVKRAVYLAGIMLQNGETNLDPLNRDEDAIVLENSYTIFDNEVAIAVNLFQDAVEEVYCNDCSDKDIILTQLLLTPHPTSVGDVPIRIGRNYASVKKVYISTLKDRTISPGQQREMYSKFPGTKVYKINASHMPMLSRPKEVVDILTGC